MRPNIAADATVRALIAAIPDNRLRELFLELALAALAVPAVEAPKPAAHNGRRRRRGKGARRGKGKHMIDRRRRAYLDTLNAKRREQRRLAREAREAAGTTKRRGRPAKNKGEGAHGNGNGRSVTVSPEALWRHATKLEPKQPWRAVARELGVSDGAARLAHRTLAMPANISPAAAARFLTL
jgi:hypothetical protein